MFIDELVSVGSELGVSPAAQLLRAPEDAEDPPALEGCRKRTLYEASLADHYGQQLSKLVFRGPWERGRIIA